MLGVGRGIEQQYRAVADPTIPLNIRLTTFPDDRLNCRIWVW